MTRITGISQAMLRNEQPLSLVLLQFLQWVTSVTAEVSDATSTSHFPGIAIDLFSNVFDLLHFNIHVVLVAHNGFSFDFPILLSEVESRDIPLSIFENHNVHFSDPLPLLRVVIKFNYSIRQYYIHIYTIPAL